MTINGGNYSFNASNYASLRKSVQAQGLQSASLKPLFENTSQDIKFGQSYHMHEKGIFHSKTFGMSMDPPSYDKNARNPRRK